MKLFSDSEKKALSQILKTHGISPSTHRMLILKELRSRNDHPSADMLFKTLSATLPTLSKTTVYNTLNLFETSCLINCLPIEGNEMRYDHHREGTLHFFCLGCGSIIDPPKGQNVVLPEHILTGFEVRQIQAIVKGFCAGCQSKNSQKNQSA